MATRMHPTTHERAELRRCADAMQRRGETAMAERMERVARFPWVLSTEFDPVMKAYRAWLVFDEPKGGA